MGRFGCHVGSAKGDGLLAVFGHPQPPMRTMLLPPKPLQEHWRKSFVIDERDQLTEYNDE